MVQRAPGSDTQNDATTMPPSWLRRTATLAPGRRAGMLEHMARGRSAAQRQAVPRPASEPSGKSGTDHVADFIGYLVFYGIIGLLLQSRFPLCLGLYFFLTDGEFVTWTLRKTGIRLEPDTIGPDVVKCFVSWFGWGTLLASWKSSAPSWLLPSMPPSTTWSFIAATALLLALIEALAALIMRRVLPWLGFSIRPGSLSWTAVRCLVIIGLLGPLFLLDYFTSFITVWLGRL